MMRLSDRYQESLDDVAGLALAQVPRFTLSIAP
jgi:hypothetical protein